MFSQYFGNYLLQKGLINPEQLADALEYQRSAHLKLGVIAINAGYMTPLQVEQVHKLQRKIDKRFGELAIERGYINDEQLDAMLKTQQQGHLMLGQAMVDRGHLTMEQLKSALDGYKKERGVSGRQFNIVGKNDEDAIERIFRDFGESMLSKTYSDYVTLLTRNIIRFIDDNPAIGIDRLNADMKAEWYARQKIHGIINLETGVACETDVFVKLAGKFAVEDITEPDELARDSVGEFLNLHNGIFLVNMSNNGIELEMEPQEVIENHTVKSQDKTYVISCHMAWGQFDVIVS